MNCDQAFFIPIRWSCRQMEFYDAAARGINELLLKDVSPVWTTFLGISCIVGMIVVLLFAFRHQP